MKIIKYLLLSSFLVFFGCEQSNTPQENEPDPTIVFGESIAKVQIGDDSSTVVKKLRKPTSYGDYGGYGDFKGYTFDYTTGVLSNTTLRISLDPGLGLGVFSMIIDGPYQGKSKEGIGINSERDFVISKLGQPDITQNGTTTDDTYYFVKNTFIISYDKNRVVRIYMISPRHK